MELEGGVNGDAFVTYVRKVLGPALTPGDVVEMDNLGAHKRLEVRELIEAAGCELVFLPAYSPDFSPIEEAFAKLKTLLRRAGARSRAMLLDVLATAIDAITPRDTTGYYRHCGYNLNPQHK